MIRKRDRKVTRDQEKISPQPKNHSLEKMVSKVFENGPASKRYLNPTSTNSTPLFMLKIADLDFSFTFQKWAQTFTPLNIS